MSFFSGSPSLFNNPFGTDAGVFGNPSYGVDSAGTFGGVGDALGGSGFTGGGNLNVGGGGGFGGLGALIAGRLGTTLLGQSNTQASAANAMGTGIGMFDVNAGVTAANRRRSLFDETQAPIIASRIKMNPDYRRGQLRDTLRNPGIAGRYAAFIG